MDFSLWENGFKYSICTLVTDLFRFVSSEEVYLFIYLLTVQYGMWDLSTPTRDWTQVPCFGSRVLSIGQPGKSPESVLGACIFLGICSFHLHYIIYCHTIAQSISLQPLYCKSSTNFPYIIFNFSNLNLFSWSVLLKSSILLVF